MEQPRPISFVIRETLLSRRPDPLSAFAMALATLAVILLSILSWNNIAGAGNWMSASPHQVFEQHQYWRAWTTLFVHGDGKHLLSNALFFFVLGSFLTGYFGISLVLMAAVFVGGLTNLVVLAGMPTMTSLIGLSGVVFWMGGAWLSLYVLIDRKRTWTQRTLRAFGVALVLFMPAEAFDPNISYKAHFVGFVFGIVAGLLYFAIFKQSLRRAEVHEAVVETEEDFSVTTPAPRDFN